MLNSYLFFLVFTELNVHIFCDYVNDGFTMVLMDTGLRGFDKPFLERINCFTP
jgi:hypothetical protein